MTIGKSREEYWQEQYAIARHVFGVATPKMSNKDKHKFAARFADRKAQEIFGVNR